MTYILPHFLSKEEKKEAAKKAPTHTHTRTHEQASEQDEKVSFIAAALREMEHADNILLKNSKNKEWKR